MSPSAHVGRPRRAHRVDETDASRSVLEELTRARTTGNPRAIRRAEDAVCLHYLDFATTIAHRFRGRGIDADDVLQVARVGLVKAVRGWRPQPGGGFLQYATPMITGEVKRFFRDHGTLIRMPRTVQQAGPAIVMAREDLVRLGRVPTDSEIAHTAGIPEELVRADRAARERCAVSSLDALDSVDDPTLRTVSDESGCSIEDRIMLRQSLSALSARERKMIGMRFFRDRTQDQIGKALGISQMQVSRLLRDTLAKMHDSLDESRPISA